MGLFGNKKKNDQVQHYSLNNKLFPVSKPWGYSPQHVEEAINGYTGVIENQKVAISKLKEEVTFYKRRYDQLETEFKNLQLQLNFVSVPSMSDIQEDYIQGKFKEKFQQAKGPESKDPFADYQDDRGAEQIISDSYSSPRKSKISMIEEEGSDIEADVLMKSSDDSDEDDGDNYIQEENSRGYEELEEEEPEPEPVKRKLSIGFNKKNQELEESNDEYSDYQDDDEESYEESEDEEYGYESDDYDNEEYGLDDEEEFKSDDEEDYEDSDQDEYCSDEDNSNDDDDDEYFSEEEPPKTDVPIEENDPSAEFLKNFGF